MKNISKTLPLSDFFKIGFAFGIRPRHGDIGEHCESLRTRGLAALRSIHARAVRFSKQSISSREFSRFLYLILFFLILYCRILFFFFFFFLEGWVVGSRGFFFPFLSFLPFIFL